MTANGTDEAVHLAQELRSTEKGRVGSTKIELGNATLDTYRVDSYVKTSSKQRGEHWQERLSYCSGQVAMGSCCSWKGAKIARCIT